MRSHPLRFLFSFWRRSRMLSPQQLHAQLSQAEPPLVLDVRTLEEFWAGHIVGALSLSVDELEHRLTALAPCRERLVVTV